MNEKIKATLTNKSINCDGQQVDAGMKFICPNNKLTIGKLTALLDSSIFSISEEIDICSRFNLRHTYNYIIITTSAKAMCDDSDTYDVVKGKRIVESRCKTKLYNKIQKILQYVYDMRKDEAIDINENILTYHIREKVEKKHIEELTL